MGASALGKIRTSWSDVMSRLPETWQTPALLAGAVLFLSGTAALIVTRPDPRYDAYLQQAQHLIDRERFEDAIEVLNGSVYPNLHKEGVSQNDRRGYHLLLARAIYRGQQELGVSLESNNASVEELYREAERLNAKLSDHDRYALADTFASSGRPDEAIEQADMLPAESREKRDEIYKRVIRAKLDQELSDEDAASTLLSKLALDPELGVDERAWVVARQTEVRLRNGFVDEAIDRVLREVPKLDEADPRAKAELFAMLGEAYLQGDEFLEAEKNLERADELLKGVGPLASRVHVLQARAAASQRRFEEARERLVLVVDRFSDTDSYLSALLLKGEVEAHLGHHDDALDTYGILIGEINEGRTSPEARPTEVAASLAARANERLEAGVLDQALRFGELGESLFGADDIPAPVLLSLANTCMNLGESLLPEPIGEIERFDPGDLDPATRREVVRYFRRAGMNYRRHADRMHLIEDERYAESLWEAARAFDHAGSLDEAIDSYREYADGFEMEAREAEARFRLGQAFQARADYESAKSYYSGLIEDHLNRASGKGVGPYGDASYVPLAQCYLEDSDTENDAEARRLLENVLRGEYEGVNSPGFRDALVELGHLHYLAGEHPRAIERFTEVLDRYPEDKGRAEVTFLLADANRLAGEAISERLDDALLDTERAALTRVRRQRLEQAIARYAEARDLFEAKDPRRLSRLESVYLRNSYFYLGDCAFDLDDYPTAIRHYDAARERYPREPSSLVAMVQIVNAHVNQGDMDRARTADERARRFFRSLPDEVWDDPNLPMKRRDWERWLDSSQRLYELGRSS